MFTETPQKNFIFEDMNELICDLQIRCITHLIRMYCNKRDCQTSPQWEHVAETSPKKFQNMVFCLVVKLEVPSQINMERKTALARQRGPCDQVVATALK